MKRFNIPVSIGPGATTLIRTPVSANSRAAALLKPSTAASAKATAVARPIPVGAPVIRTTWFDIKRSWSLTRLLFGRQTHGVRSGVHSAIYGDIRAGDV